MKDREYNVVCRCYQDIFVREIMVPNQKEPLYLQITSFVLEIPSNFVPKNKTTMKKTTNNTQKIMNKKTTRKQKSKKAVGANARRKTNKRWKHVEASDCYRKAAIEELCNVTTNQIEIEVLDGIFLNLKIKNQVKTSRVQDRILRRIVEKRQAQAYYKKFSRSEDLATRHITLTCTSKCMEDIKKKRTCS